MSLKVRQYALNLDFTSAEFFEGKCTISIQTDETSTILDAKNMDIISVRLDGKDWKFTQIDQRKKLVIDGITHGDHEIQIGYKSTYNTGLTGVYIAGSPDLQMITTQFEATGASYAFPCYDNPEMKSAFLITMRVRDGMDGISNMPQASRKHGEDGNVEITFQKTPIMSTYLVYFGVGNFTTKTRKHGNCEIILARPGKEMRSDDYPLDVADRCMSFYEEYFGIPYVLPKMHLIAVPDFAAGAMENWGAITFREELLLHNENTDLETKISISVVIAHEIAHQWFGDLVTMKWWNDLWLNESFATFMSSLCINSIYPQYEEEKTYFLHDTVYSMNSDALKSSHPINVEVNNPEEIEQIFDEISYGKGGSILRMIHHYVGDENFRKGLSSYLKKFQFSNAMGSDLWNELEKASGMKVSSIMDNWINQSGFPLLKADYDGRTLKVEQQQLFLNGGESGKIWKIPLFIKTQNEEKKILMEEKTILVEIQDLVKINSKGYGYYQSEYSSEIRKRIEQNMGSLSPLDRAEMINETYFLFMSGNITMDQYFELALNVSKKFDNPASLLLTENLVSLYRVLYDRDQFLKKFKEVLNNLLQSSEEKKEKGSLDIIAVQKIKNALSTVDMNFAIKLAEPFSKFYELPPDQRQNCALAKALTSQDITDMEQMLTKAEDDSDRVTLIMAMGWARGKKNHKQIIKMIIRGKIKRQDSPYVVLELIRNPDARSYITQILGPLMKGLNKFMGDTGLLSTAMYMAIPLLGLENEKKVRKVVSKFDYNKIRMGAEKGFELLEIHKTLRIRTP